ncbi:30S ribosomal protein S6 [Candidatus Latescibacterota bacterium]
MKKRYDTSFIIDGTLSVDDREKIIETVCNSLKKHGGEIEQVIRWGTRTLSHEINKRNRGYYVVLYYTAEPSIIKTFERELRINENILRYMTLVFEGVNPTYIVDEGVKSENSYISNDKAEVVEDTDSEADIDDTESDVDVDFSSDVADVEDTDDKFLDATEDNMETDEIDILEKEPMETDEIDILEKVPDESADDTDSESTSSENEDIADDDDIEKEDKE